MSGNLETLLSFIYSPASKQTHAVGGVDSPWIAAQAAIALERFATVTNSHRPLPEKTAARMLKAIRALAQGNDSEAVSTLMRALFNIARVRPEVLEKLVIASQRVGSGGSSEVVWLAGPCALAFLP